MQVEVLSAVVSSVANSVGAPTVVDVGSGQVLYLQFVSHAYVSILISWLLLLIFPFALLKSLSSRLRKFSTDDFCFYIRVTVTL